MKVKEIVVALRICLQIVYNQESKERDFDLLTNTSYRF